MFWWKKRNEGFEWRDYVRTTILVRREHRRQKLKDVQEAAAANVKKAGKRSVEASASGARNAGRAVWHHSRAAAGTLAAWGGQAGRSAASGSANAARWMAASAGALGQGAGRLGQRAGQPLAPVLDPLLSFLRQPGARLALAAVALVTALGAAYRTWGFGFDADARLAAVVAVVTAALLLLAVLTDPRRAPRTRDRDSLLTRLGAKGRDAFAAGSRSRTLNSELPPRLWSPCAPLRAFGTCFLTPRPVGRPHRRPPARCPKPIRRNWKAAPLPSPARRIAGNILALDGIEAPGLRPASRQCTHGKAERETHTHTHTHT